MRLFLASYRFGADPTRFTRLTRGPGPVAVIANAADAWPARAREAAVTSELGPLRSLGYTPTEVDLREFRADPDGLRTVLGRFPTVWVRGGNTFVLRAQLARCGGDVVLTELVCGGHLTYGGYSAGACVATPTLHGLEFSDDPAEVAVAGAGAVHWDGLGWVEHAIVPHADGSPLGDEGVERTVEHLRTESIPFVALGDDEVIVVDDDSAPASGKVVSMSNNTDESTVRLEHEPSDTRFALYIDDALAAYAEYTQHGDLRDFDHTVTEPDFRGRGLAGRVVKFALDATRDEGLKIGASCSYVENFVSKNPEYRN